MISWYASCTINLVNTKVLLKSYFFLEILRLGGFRMVIDLEGVKIIDVHCHPFLQNERPYMESEFLEELSLSVRPGMFATKIKTKTDSMYSGLNMYMQITIQRLAKYFSCEPTIEAVVEKRNVSARNFSEYTKNLFEDVQLEGLLVDYGYPTPAIPNQQFEKVVGFRTWEVYRIEPVMDRLREEHDSFSTFIEGYRADLRSALGRKGVLGLKSIIAYRSGLEIVSMDEKKATSQFDFYKENKRETVKELRDYCLHIAMEECTRAKKAMHIHTGVGDGEVLLHKASPNLLVTMLREKKYANTIVHLVHGGYPWMEEAAFMCSVFPNVYMDLSLQNPFAGHGVKRIISQVFEFAPFNKVMYGSDAFTIPEMNWLGVKLFKECFEEVLQSWVEKDYMSRKRAKTIAELVLYKNFEELYKDSL